jgi:hypothetical protein
MPKLLSDRQAAAAVKAAAATAAAAAAAGNTVSSRRHLAFLLLGYGQTAAVQWAESKLGIIPNNGRSLYVLGPLEYLAMQYDNTYTQQQMCILLGSMYKQDGQYKKAEPFMR